MGGQPQLGPGEEPPKLPEEDANPKEPKEPKDKPPKDEKLPEEKELVLDYLVDRIMSRVA